MYFEQSWTNSNVHLATIILPCTLYTPVNLGRPNLLLPNVYFQLNGAEDKWTYRDPSILSIYEGSLVPFGTGAPSTNKPSSISSPAAISRLPAPTWLLMPSMFPTSLRIHTVIAMRSAADDAGYPRQSKTSCQIVQYQAKLLSEIECWTRSYARIHRRGVCSIDILENS
jgi:hypothetical protein